MQKIIKLETENTTVERWTENSACEIYSHDTNNGHFEIEVMNEALTDETVTALFIFEESESVWRTEGIIEENKIKFKFDTTLITQDETVICVLYLDNERENNDFYRFSFKVKISEIDKLDNLTIKERLFKNNLIIDRLEVVTKDELKEALKNLDLSSISTDGLLTEEKANGLYAKISELEAVESKLITQEQLTSTKNEVVTEINNRLENYALKTNIPEPYNDTNLVGRVTDLENKQDKDTIYDDSELKARISVLESREDNNTIYDDTNVRDRLTVLENKPNIDISNLATKDELNEVRNSQPTVDTSNLVTKQELEEKHFLTTHQDLSEYALKSELPQPYNDSALVQKIGQLEARVDNDTIYNDTEVKNRLTELENKPTLDTSEFVTNQALENKNYITEEILNSKGYAKTSEIPTPYNDSEVKQRLTNLESIDTSKFITDEKLESKGYLKSHQDITGLATKEELANLVTNDQLEAKHYITGATLENYALKSDIPQGYNDTEVKERLTVLENKQDKDTIYNDTELRTRVSELEQRPIATPYNDTALSDRVSALESKQDKDTIYNDSELRQRVETLENKPPIDTSKFITEEVLESKNYLTTPYNDIPLKGRIEALENKVDKDTVYNDEPIKERLTALESKPNIDLTGYATKEELKAKVNTSDYDTFKNMVVTKGYLESKNYLTEQYNDKPLTDRVVALESKTTTNQWEIHGSGMPNGVVEAELGTTYVDKNKTNGALKWIKTTNGGNQGWEVLIGDTGWRNLNSTSKLKVGDKTSFIKIRRVNNLVTYQFGGLQWGWFGIVRRNGPGFVKHNSSGDKGAKVLGVSGIPEGFRSETSLVGPTYDDKGRPYGIWYLGGKTDSNFIQFTFNEDIPTDRDIGDIRVSTISYLTEEPWPTKLP